MSWIASRRPSWRMSALLLGAFASGVIGCESAAVGPSLAPVKPVPIIEPRTRRLGDGAAGEFASLRFGLRLPLPDGKAWRIDDHTSGWLVATHAASASELAVRVWRDDTVMNRDRCEARARLWRTIPERGSTDIVEKRPVDVPQGFDTVVEVGVIAPLKASKTASPAADLRGVAMAFGGRGKRCFAWIYTTSAGGPGAEATVGERLATMVQASLSQSTAVNELDPQIDHAPAP